MSGKTNIAGMGLAVLLLTLGANGQSPLAVHAALSLPSAPGFEAHTRSVSVTQDVYNFRATGRSYALHGGAPTLGDTTASGAIYYPNTQILYLNYADAARADYAAMTQPATATNGADADPMSYTLRMGGANATVGMGGGDVQMSQPGLMALTGAAAMAEASLDISDSQHRFGFRVQGRALSTQPLYLSTANVNQMKLILSAKPLLTAYVHF